MFNVWFRFAQLMHVAPGEFSPRISMAGRAALGRSWSAWAPAAREARWWFGAATAAQIRQRHLAGQPWEVIEVGGSLNQSEVAVKATEPSTLGVIYGCVFSNGEPHISKWCISYLFLWLLNGHKYSIDQIEELSLLWNSDIMWYIYI